MLKIVSSPRPFSKYRSRKWQKVKIRKFYNLGSTCQYRQFISLPASRQFAMLYMTSMANDIPCFHFQWFLSAIVQWVKVTWHPNIQSINSTWRPRPHRVWVLGKSTYMHYTDIIMRTVVTQITSVSIVYISVCSGPDQRKHPTPTSLAFVRGIHRWPVNSSHKGSVTWKMSPFDDVIMVVVFRFI